MPLLVQLTLLIIDIVFIISYDIVFIVSPDAYGTPVLLMDIKKALKTSVEGYKNGKILQSGMYKNGEKSEKNVVKTSRIFWPRFVFLTKCGVRSASSFEAESDNRWRTWA